MSDENERSVASGGSVAAKPVAWAALRDDGDIAWIGYTPEGAADGACGRRIVPLYLQPQDGVVRLPRRRWDLSEKMGKGEWDYQQRVKTALEVAGVKWVEIE